MPNISTWCSNIQCDPLKNVNGPVVRETESQVISYFKIRQNKFKWKIFNYLQFKNWSEALKAVGMNAVQYYIFTFLKKIHPFAPLKKSHINPIRHLFDHLETDFRGTNICENKIIRHCNISNCCVAIIRTLLLIYYIE